MIFADHVEQECFSTQFNVSRFLGFGKSITVFRFGIFFANNPSCEQQVHGRTSIQLHPHFRDLSECGVLA